MVQAKPFEQFLEVVWGTLHRLLTPLRLVEATSEPLCSCLFFFLLGWLEVPSPVSSSRFALPLRWLKIALTAFSLEAWLVAMLRSSLVIHGPLHPSL